MIILGDCLEKLRELPDNSVDSLVTDPPAGISFMQKSWDSDKGGRENWINWLTEIMLECKRVMKPGAHGFVWAIPRTSHWTATALENAGFEVRDVVTHLFGSGFPKSHNLKGEWQGWGTALKPASEHWILIRKPLIGTVAENVLKYGCGAINVDAGRIECESRPLRIPEAHDVKKSLKATTGGSIAAGETTQGRWPANVILDEVAAEMLDEQTGSIRSRHGYKRQGQTGGGTGSSYKMKKCDIETSEKVVDPSQNGYLGGASRYFYVAKASKRERNAGLEGMPEIDFSGGGGVNHAKADAYGARKSGVNFHPTVKPIKLMEYLCKLICPPGGIVLDPFMGSGSTGVAAKNLGFNFIGIELSEEYFEIAKRRIEHSQKEAA